ncbi:MAG: ABC transporter permease, partial [Candidatus Rokuibacteriota bacterium]
MIQPPRVAEWLLQRFVPRGLVGESIVGDMRESFADSLSRRGRARAGIEYWTDVVRISMSRVGRPRPGGDQARESSGSRRGQAGDGRTGTAGGRAPQPARRGPSFAFFTHDLRFVLRGLIKSPGFTLATVFCLALGIGANSAIFSVIRGVLLRELPFREPVELVLLRTYDAGNGAGDPLSRGTQSVSYLDGQDWLGSASLEDVALLGLMDYRMLGAALPEQIAGSPVFSNLFSLLGARPALGRVFGPDETDAVVVLSHSIWQRAFGGSPDVIGRVIRLNDLPFEIVGVMPPSFRVPPTHAELWVPIDAVPMDAA